MKKLTIPIFVCLALAGCTDKFDELNTSETGIVGSSVLPQMVLGRCMYKGSSADHQRNFNLYDDQYAHYFANDLNSSEYYVFRDDWGGIYWRDFYTERLREYIQVDELCGDKADYACIKAVNDIWNVILWLRIVDRYGDAPYKDAAGNYAGHGDVMGYTPVEEIYPDLISRLQDDVKKLDSTAGQKTLGNYDLVYGNDWAKWKKLANTLIMRLGMRLSGTAIAETGKAAFAGAAGGAMDAPEDYARISCDSSIWGDYYDRTFYDWHNTKPEEDFMTVLAGEAPNYHTGVVDPRRAFWFSKGADEATGWSGWPNGTVEHDAIAGYNYANFAQLSVETADGFFFFDHHNSALQNLSWCYATYSETLFLKAEAALRGWTGGDPEALYKEAIKASMDEIGAFITRSGGKATVGADEYNAYLNALPAFGSSNEDKLESIMTQKWIALYPNSVEAWAEIRRTGYPRVINGSKGIFHYPIVNSSATVTNGNMIERLPYPDNEYNTNEANMPEEFRTGGTLYGKRQEQGLFWSLPGKNKAQSKDAAPGNF